MLISGRCHCGNIAFALLWNPDALEIPARVCGCSFCIKHGGVWASCAAGSLKVTVQNPSLVSKYTFGTKTAEFHICAKCGIVPVVTSRIEDRLYAVVSVNAFEDAEPSMVKRTAASFDGESEEMRLLRRKRNWIGDVEIVEGG